MKRTISKALSGIAGVAAVVAFFAPVSTAHQFIIFAAALLVAVVFGAIAGGLDDENVGYWPEEPIRTAPKE